MNGSITEDDPLFRSNQTFKETAGNTFLKTDTKLTSSLDSNFSSYGRDDPEFVDVLSSTIHGQYILNAVREKTYYTR